MNKFKIRILFLILVITSSFTLHKFYVGVFQIDYVKEKKALHITTRLFIDDFEKALHKKYKKHFYITTKDEVNDANLFIQNYLEEKFKIKINNKIQKIFFLAKEQEDNIIICYLKIDCKEKIKEIEITNNVLTELYSEQQNLIHLNINSNKKTLLFTNTDNNQKTKYN